MKLILQPTVETIIELNQTICLEGDNPHQCLDRGKIESAISSAFYPGVYPFVHGGLAKIAGALCFYLVKAHAFLDGNKRTGALTAITFLNLHNLDLKYPLNLKKDVNALAQIIDDCAASKISQEELKIWFEKHKVNLE